VHDRCCAQKWWREARTPPFTTYERKEACSAHRGHILLLTPIRQALLDDFDFESVYHRVLSGPFTGDEKTGLIHAVKEAYAYIDSLIENLLGSDVNINPCRR